MPSPSSQPAEASSLSKGHYYKKQFGCSCGPVAWSHRSRFDLALRLLGDSPGTVLDYGCGDGTFLALASSRVPEGWGVDIEKGQIDDCRARFANRSNLQFHTVAELRDSKHDRGFDTVFCMETLEHCTAEVVPAVMRDLARLVTPSGRVVISVPIETGPTFLLKWVIRTVAARRGLSDYAFYERYPPGDALRMIFSWSDAAVKRPIYGGPGNYSHSHYGFNWRSMRKTVADSFQIQRTLFSPLGVSRGWLSSQAWFICRPKGARA